MVSDRLMPTTTTMPSSRPASPPRHSTLRLATIVALGSGCVAGPPSGDAAESQTSAEIVAANGTSVNGTSVNGISINGISINGVSASGMQLRGVAATGDNAGQAITGDDWIGAVLAAQLTNGTRLALRIDDTTMLPAPNSDIRSYAISYATSDGWKPLCTNPEFGNQAIVFPGTWNLTTVRHQWDSNMFSLGCRGATFAKCVELGYKGDSLIDTYHAACVRAIRADYCGDGQSHTITGTEINIYDKLGVQGDTQRWSTESNWTPDGATCIHIARVLTSLEEPNVPACIADRAQVECVSSGWPSRVLIRTEVNK